MRSIYSLDKEEIKDYMVNIGGKSYHGGELFKWLYEKKINDFNDITNVKKDLLEQVKKDFLFNTISMNQKEYDSDVNKYLFMLEDNECVEAVLMRHDYGNSICVSSQVGCNMGCAFCESGRRKKVRDLKPNEMVEQVLLVEDDIKEKITHVVIMGIGEPFDNYDNVVKFIKIINDGNGLKIGSRHITVSTCGIIPKIKEFKDFPYQVNLAISLHAPNDEIRKKIMPIAKVYPLDDLMKALKEYVKKTNRRLTFEYVMLKDVNDSSKCALQLVKLIKGINAYVNLIPYNKTLNIEYDRSSVFKIMKFYDILKKNNINVTIRKEFGTNISAACGQLRSKKEEL